MSKTIGTPTKPPNRQGESLEILTVQQVAARLQLPLSSVYEKTRFRATNGGSPLPCRRVGRYLRFVASEVDAWFLDLPAVRHSTKRKYKRKLVAVQRKAAA
jgi:predicted DNA-binding transcriptional regulator AlpA